MKSRQAHKELSDERLIRLVQQGDAEAFRELYARYKRRILAYCFRMMRDRDAAHDAFQMIFTNFFEKRNQFDGEKFSAWLYGIARNVCLKSLQKIQSERNNFAKLEIEDIIEAPQSEQEKDFFEELLRAIQQLPDEFREPVQLCYFDRLSYEEISAVLGISLALVKVRIHRAKKMLKEILTHSSQEHHESR